MADRPNFPLFGSRDYDGRATRDRTEATTATRELRTIAEWLADGARNRAGPDQVLAELCDRLVAQGVPISRVAVFVSTLHPDIMGRAFFWRPGEPVKIAEATWAFLERPEYKDNPVPYVSRTGERLRRHIADPDCPLDFPLMKELRAESATDYFAAPLAFTNGENHVVSFTTHAPGGFTDAQMAILESIVDPLARVAEIRALRRTAGNLLNTYVGRQAGERILAGRIRRGHSESIDAAIWLSDLRGFTALADRIPAQELIEVLNHYFDCQVPAIADHGGEILKFMGDGLLAIFPIREDRPADIVCGAALEAARDAMNEVEELRKREAAPAYRDLRFAISLHVGEVLYGNIGGKDRLDFTCIGPAVNLTARIEKTARDLGRTVVASPEFVHHCPAKFTHLGDFALRGFGARHAVYGLADEVTDAVSA
ncbi:MAG: adenylate/guanylate cyclase domain-containing protein [Alphaproteobacteria bacterium]|nr:adenylate/guanylate cyclase domain-containing protein [Alphaproteobacteria bacterium]